MTKKILAIVLAALMLLTLFAGCSNNSGASTTAASTTKAGATTAAGTTAAAAPAVNDWGVLPIVNEPITVSIGIADTGYVTDYDDNYYVKYLEESTGIDLDCQPIPASEYYTKVDLLVAAGGDDLPNVLMGWMGGLNFDYVTTWGTNGFLADLTDWYDQMYYMPQAVANTAAFDWETTKAKLASYDGKIYTFPTMTESIGDYVYYSAIQFYVPWLEQFGMYNLDENNEFFTNLDQVVAFCEAVKTQDPNGNGKADEIPMTGWASSYDKYCFVSAFTKTNPDAFYIDTASNSVKFNFDREEYRNALRFMNMLVENGYLDPLSFTQDRNTMYATIVSDKNAAVVGSFIHGSNSGTFGDTHPTLRENDYKSAQGFAVDANDTRFNFMRSLTYGAGGVITKTCENVEATVKMLDFWGSEENSWTNNMGFEGEDWKYISDLTEGAWGNAWGRSDEETFLVMTPAQGGRVDQGQPHNLHLQSTGPKVLNFAWDQGWASDTSDVEAWEFTLERCSKLEYIYYNVTDTSNLLAGQRYNAEESTVRSEIWSPINTYINECYTRFIMGDLDLDSDWDAYVAELYNMGLQDVIDAENSCYDRMYK